MLSKMCDIWAFGCILLELCTGKMPYKDLDAVAVPGQLLQGETPLKFALAQYNQDELHLLSDGDNELQVIIERCLSLNHK